VTGPPQDPGGGGPAALEAGATWRGGRFRARVAEALPASVDGFVHDGAYAEPRCFWHRGPRGVRARGPPIAGLRHFARPWNRGPILPMEGGPGPLMGREWTVAGRGPLRLRSVAPNPHDDGTRRLAEIGRPRLAGSSTRSSVTGRPVKRDGSWLRMGFPAVVGPRPGKNAGRVRVGRWGVRGGGFGLPLRRGAGERPGDDGVIVGRPAWCGRCRWPTIRARGGGGALWAGIRRRP